CSGVGSNTTEQASPVSARTSATRSTCDVNSLTADLDLAVSHRPLDAVRQLRARIQQRRRTAGRDLLGEHRAAFGGWRRPLDTGVFRTVLLHQYVGAARLAVVRREARGEELVAVSQGIRPCPRLSESRIRLLRHGSPSPCCVFRPLVLTAMLTRSLPLPAGRVVLRGSPPLPAAIPHWPWWCRPRTRSAASCPR